MKTYYNMPDLIVSWLCTRTTLVSSELEIVVINQTLCRRVSQAAIVKGWRGSIKAHNAQIATQLRLRGLLLKLGPWDIDIQP
jgi:hypothetical protein